MSSALKHYIQGKDVKITDIDFKLALYILKERWKIMMLLILLLLFAFFVGFYAGYSNALVEFNKIIIENQYGACLNWTM